MNILILNWRDVWHPKSGGAEYVTYEHAKSWVKAGHRVTWFTSRYDGVPDREEREGISIIRSAGSHLVYLSAPFFLIRHSREYDVVVDEIHGIPFFSPFFTRKPVVVFIHEVADEIWDYMYRFPLNTFGKTLESMYFRLYRKNYFWTDAPSTIDELVKRGIRRDRCTAIACPVEQVSVRKFSKEKHPTYIFVSRVVRMKGIEEVVKAFAFIVKEQPDAALWIVGGGDSSYVQRLKDMIDEYGIKDSVRFWGRVSQEKKYELMSRAHILLHASVKEGWGLVVLEAAVSGTPSVVYNVGGLKDIVKNGETGVVIRDSSPHSMAREAIRLFGDTKRYTKLQKGARSWVASITWKNAAQKSLSILEKAAGVSTDDH